MTGLYHRPLPDYPLQFFWFFFYFSPNKQVIRFIKGIMNFKVTVHRFASYVSDFSISQNAHCLTMYHVGVYFSLVRPWECHRIYSMSTLLCYRHFGMCVKLIVLLSIARRCGKEQHVKKKQSIKHNNVSRSIITIIILYFKTLSRYWVSHYFS